MATTAAATGQNQRRGRFCTGRGAGTAVVLFAGVSPACWIGSGGTRTAGLIARVAGSTRATADVAAARAISATVAAIGDSGRVAARVRPASASCSARVGRWSRKASKSARTALASG
ncbi:hypothetical protein D3C83_02830 [compost metagenome]